VKSAQVVGKSTSQCSESELIDAKKNLLNCVKEAEQRFILTSDYKVFKDCNKPELQESQENYFNLS
jgi:hypothetical protein